MELLHFDCMNRLPVLNDMNYGIWKIKMRAFIRGIDVDAWDSVETGWNPPVLIDEKGNVSLKPRASWTDEEKRRSNLDAKALSAIFASVDLNNFWLISGCESAKEAWTTIVDAFEGSGIAKRLRLDMLDCMFEKARMGEEEKVADFSARLCHIAIEADAMRKKKKYGDKRLVRKLMESLPGKFFYMKTAMEMKEMTKPMEQRLKLHEVVGILTAEEVAMDLRQKDGLKKKASQAEFGSMVMLRKRMEKMMRSMEQSER
ncbi:PREDICTED: uncharacterized protein LOC109117030 [Tarenaya hassleriana]|uniref:uncharacterized protein LOC109117030 n=1 Tax=Tarenaya hassleriana TaxID=28532 RepID=UPI0008FD7C11|nr:PREDICTED: uncharacterized protein LOC109117030 [Tarenaya hassleriana]